MEYVATLVKHPPEYNAKNDFFLVGPLVPMRINWLPTKFSVLNFGKQSFKLILVFFVTIVDLFVLSLTKISHLLSCKSAAWVSHKGPLWKDIELLVTEIYVSMFSETQNLFCFLPEMVKDSPKELFKIARCFRSYYWKLPKSHRKIQNDGNHPKPHTVILNTFGTQGTKMIQASIICSQILMLWSKPSFFWPRRILLFSLRTSLFDSQLLNVYRVFFCLQLEISLSVSGPASKRRTHFLWCKFFFFFSPRETNRKD